MGQKPRRQDSYLQAVSSEYQALSPTHQPYQHAGGQKNRRQASYQQAVGTLSPQEDLPDLKDPEMAKAAVKIQSVFKGFKVRQKQAENADLPNLNDKDVQAATVKIQSAFKGKFYFLQGFAEGLVDFHVY